MWYTLSCCQWLCILSQSSFNCFFRFDVFWIVFSWLNVSKTLRLSKTSWHGFILLSIFYFCVTLIHRFQYRNVTWNRLKTFYMKYWISWSLFKQSIMKVVNTKRSYIIAQLINSLRLAMILAQLHMNLILYHTSWAVF